MTSPSTTQTPSAPAAPDAPSDARPALRVEGLTHRYPVGRRSRQDSLNSATTKPALDGIDLIVRAGEVFGLLGPNGSGKSTLFRIIATLLRPSAGKVTVFDTDATTDPRAVREHLGVVFQSPSLDVQLTARENLTHQGKLHGLSGSELNQRIDALLEQFDLRNRADDRVEQFSGGMRRRVELAKALLHEPSLLLMDEPATGLDPGARRDMWDHILDLRARLGVTVVLTTHLMDEADRCDRIAIVSQGKIAAIDTPAALKATIGGDVVTIEPTPGQDADELVAALSEQQGQCPRVIEGVIRCETTDAPAVVTKLTGSVSDKIARISVAQPTLEDVFLNVTGHRLDVD